MSDQSHAEEIDFAAAEQRQGSPEVLQSPPATELRSTEQTEKTPGPPLPARTALALEYTLSIDGLVAADSPAHVRSDEEGDISQERVSPHRPPVDDTVAEPDMAIAPPSPGDLPNALDIKNTAQIDDSHISPTAMVSSAPITAGYLYSKCQTSEPEQIVASTAVNRTSSHPGPPIPHHDGTPVPSSSGRKPSAQGLGYGEDHGSLDYTQEEGLAGHEAAGSADDADADQQLPQSEHPEAHQGDTYSSSATPDVSVPASDDAGEDDVTTKLHDFAPSRDALLLSAIQHFRQRPLHDVSYLLGQNVMLADSESQRHFPSSSSSASKAPARAIIRRHLAKQGALVARIQGQTASVRAKEEDLKSEYKRLDALWRLDCKMLENADTLRPPQVLFAGYPATAAPTPAPATPHLEDGTPARANRRRDAAGFSGDTALTEAEFENILIRLNDADMRDPNLRAAKTTAVVPDMGLGRYTAEDFDDQNGLVTDPITFYEADCDQAAKWTDDEREAFLKGYLLWPKQFGKVVKRLLPNKTAPEAVLYYYRTKKEFDYKEALGAKGGQRRRRPGSGRRPGKASLMAGLARQQPSMLNPTESSRLQDKTTSGGPPRREDSPVLSDSLDNDADAYAQSEVSMEVNPRPNARNASDADSANEVASQIRKRKVTHGENAGDRPPRKKAATSSYWSTAEKMLVVKLLSSTRSPDFAQIASSLENKSAQQVRNWFANHHAEVAASNPSLFGKTSTTGLTTSTAAPVTSSSDVDVQQSALLPRTGLFQPMPNALHSLVSDSSVHERRASNTLVGPETPRARGLNIAALLNEDASEARDSEKHKREVMGEWFGREELRPRDSPEPARPDDAASDGTEEDMHAGM